MRLTNGVSIGALSKGTGVNIETIRFYERIGVMPAPERSPGGFRTYREDHLKRLSFVRRGRELGFSLADLRGLLRLVDGHAYTCAQVRALTLQHLAETRRKIADLRRLERVMSEMAAKCTGRRVPDCPIIDALFDMGSTSSGGGFTRGLIRQDRRGPWIASERSDAIATGVVRRPLCALHALDQKVLRTSSVNIIENI